jgi:hypothetical protein
MTIRRRSLRKLLVAAGCLVGSVRWPAAAVGGVLLLAGAGLHLWSKGCLEQNRRLTTAGPYRFTRNPFYLANALIDLGLVCVIGRVWVALVYGPLWVIAYRDTVAREEARLEALFPEEARAHRAAVPRWIPTGRGLPADRARGGFDWRNPALAQGREYARLVGVALAPWAIWAAEVLRRERLDVLSPGHAVELAAIVLLGAAWIVKLGLAETFRRPATVLVPGAARPMTRVAVAAVAVAAAMAVGEPWAAALPIVWIALVALDRIGAARLPGGAQDKDRPWPFAPAIGAGSLAIFAALVLLGGRGGV